MNNQHHNPVEEVDYKGKTLVKDKGDLKALADKIIKEEMLLDVEEAEVGFVEVYPYISKRTAARCMKCSAEMKLYSGYDYVIEVSGDLWNKLDEEKQYILMFHELMHVMPVYNEKKGEWNFTIADHDVQDFRKIINKHGVDWIDELKTLTESVHDTELESVNL